MTLDRQICVRMSRALAERIEVFARAKRMKTGDRITSGDAVRELIERGLKQVERDRGA